MMDLIKNLKYHFKDKLQKIGWLDNHTKNTAREVLSSSLYEIVTPSEISEVIEREGIYNNVSNGVVVCVCEVNLYCFNSKTLIFNPKTVQRPAKGIFVVAKPTG